MRRVLRVWALCCGFAVLWSYDTIRFEAIDPRSLFAADSAPDSATRAPEAECPPGANYSSFLALAAGRDPNRTATTAGNSTDSPLLAYFPDFCADCVWAGSQTCAGRVDYLKNKYGTPNAEVAVMEDRVVCRNPPIQIFWQDDGVDELDSVFAQPRISRGDATGSPMLGRISIYFYETLREDVGDRLVNSAWEQYSHRNNTETNAQADVAVIDLFRTFPGRTDDPAAADLFVVPYPHASHCVSKPDGVWMAACKHISRDLVQNGVFAALNHYAGNEKRHLFLNIINQGNSNPIMRNTPLSATIGPRYKATNIIVPYLNNLPSFQPSAVRGRGAGWWTRPRTYSLTYFFGISNSQMRNSARVYRRSFMEEVQRNWPDALGGLPYAIRVMTRGNKPPSRLFTYMYKNSVFCPTLPGDTPPQKRFFDVILMGCIPVVLAFDTESGTSWHQPGGQPIENSYPWMRGSNSTDPRNEIDYRSFVVEVRGGVENVRPTIEALMQNCSEVRRRQLNLMKYAPYFSYGMGADSHKHPDAFSKILESLRFYLDGPYLGS